MSSWDMEDALVTGTVGGCGVIFALLGAACGFTQAGIGGAIVGLVCGAVCGLILGILLLFLFAISLLLAVPAAIILLIYLLWGVGK